MLPVGSWLLVAAPLFTAVVVGGGCCWVVDAATGVAVAGSSMTLEYSVFLYRISFPFYIKNVSLVV